jgi:hypothetical protein
VNWIVYRLLADALLVVHLLFIAFVVAGGLLALRWRRIVWIHLPAAAWGALVELTSWICPLTPLEIHFRLLSGGTGYQGDFIGRILLSVIYPDGLTREIQIMLGLLVVGINLIVYWRVLNVWRRQRAKKKTGSR